MRYVSIREAYDALMEHPLMRDLTLEKVVRYAVEFLRILNVPKTSLQKTAVLAVRDYRAELPCDFEKPMQLRSLTRGKAYRGTTDTFHHSPLQPWHDGEPFDELTYRLQGNYLYSSVAVDDAEMAYEAIAVDGDGLPMIPDDAKVMRAFELYVKQKWFTMMFDMGKVAQNVIQNIQQEYCWAIGAAQSSLNNPSLDEMTTLVNELTSLVSRPVEHDYGYRHAGDREVIKNQRGS